MAMKQFDVTIKLDGQVVGKVSWINADFAGSAKTIAKSHFCRTARQSSALPFTMHPQIAVVPRHEVVVDLL